MASWFRAAEELFEVVDRRAKQVTDDILVGQNAGTDFGVFGRVIATSPLTKGGSSGKDIEVSHASLLQDGGTQSKANSLESSSTTSGAPFRASDEAESLPSFLQNHSPKESEQERDFPEESGPKDFITQGSRPDIAYTIMEGEAGKKETASHDNRLDSLSDTLYSKVQEAKLENFDPVKCRFIADNTAVSVELIITDASDSEIAKTKELDIHSESKTKFLEKVVSSPQTAKVLHDNPIDDKTVRDHPTLNGDKLPGPPKVEEQLDEGQGLLKTAVSTGQSKEARLARVCAGLSSRLQEYKNENTQLEALLQKEKEEASALRLQINQMQLELTSGRASASLAESEMSAALTSKNAEIEVILSSLENAKKQAALSEGKLAAMQANMEALTRNRDMTESGMIQTLKEALEAAERRAEEEHAAHLSTRKAAVQRESELEQCVADTNAALSRMQRMVDERTQRASDLEHKIASLEIDCVSLSQELQGMETKLRREQKRPPEEAAQLQAWREDADRARENLKEAEGRNQALEAENQKLRVELSGLKREADQFTTQAHLELEKRFRDLTEVLYLKQTQLEAMTSEKAAAIFQLEKELNKAKEAQAEVERHKRIRNSIPSWDDENEMQPLQSLGLQKKRLVGTSIQRAAKLLDSGSVTAGRFLWRRPLARLGVFFYLVFVHAFLLYLLHRLQEQAASFMSSREELEAAAAGAGLVRRGMP